MKPWDRFVDRIVEFFYAISKKKQKKGSKSTGKKENTFLTICKGIVHFRGVILGAMVLILAIVIAVVSFANLPAMVGIDLQSDGSFTMMLPKLIAVLLPLLVTMVSVFFLVISKRVLYPWLISMFTLVIPVVIYITNVFPA